MNQIPYTLRTLAGEEETRQGETVINRAEYIYEPFEVKK